MKFRSPLEPREVHERLLGYPTLATLVQTGLLTVEAHVCAIDRFARNNHSGKTPLLIDNRGTRASSILQGAHHESSN